MYYLGFIGVEDDYPEQKSSLPIKKKEESGINEKGRGYQSESFCKKDSNRTCYLQDKEIQDNE